MAKKTFVTLRVLIVAFTMLIFGWLFLSRPYIHASLSGVSCEPVGWNFLERPYSSLSYVEGDGDEIETFMNENHFDEKYFDRVSRNLHEGCNLAREDRRITFRRATMALFRCNLAREDRRFYMTVLTVVAATAFITLPKPKRKERSRTIPAESDQPTG